MVDGGRYSLQVNQESKKREKEIRIYSGINGFHISIEW
jgi:hypothetical protein